MIEKILEKLEAGRKKYLFRNEDFYNGIRRGYEESIKAIEEVTKEYEDKKAQGLIIELPVPLGTKVYRVVEDETAAIIDIIKHNGHEYRRKIPCYFVCRDVLTFSMLNELGKTVFLTLEEAKKAEEALEKIGGK